MKSRDKNIIDKVVDLLSQQGYQTNTKATPAPKRSNKRTYTQAKENSSEESDDDNDDFGFINGKKKNVITSSPINHGTKAAKFLGVLTNNFDLTY